MSAAVLAWVLLVHASAHATAAPPPPIYACMTTTPARIGLLNYTLHSLLAQKERLSSVILAVPHTFRRDPRQQYKLPAFLAQEPLKGFVRVVRCEDHGPGAERD